MSKILLQLFLRIHLFTGKGIMREMCLFNFGFTCLFVTGYLCSLTVLKPVV